MFFARKNKKILHRNNQTQWRIKMRNLKERLARFGEIVSKNFCYELSQKTGFIKRSTSRLLGYEFAQAMMIPNGFVEAETLNSLAVRIHAINSECNLSASALAQRINTKSAVEFMKACFARALKETVKKELVNLPDIPNLSGFNRILIEDSTRAELNEKLSPCFKGSSGSASEASVKIDYVFDYLSEDIVTIDFFPGSMPDQKLSTRLIAILEKDDLVIRDLGYYALDRLKEIEQKGAYYISRFKAGVAAYESRESKKPLDLTNFLDKRACQGIVEVELFLGREKHPVRLVACLMSEEIANKRRREANKQAQRKGRMVSKKKSNLLKYCIFITNVPEAILSTTSVMSTYRARWRVELIFKQWKSCLKIHLFKGHNRERLYCFLYGRFIMILLVALMSSSLMRYAFKLGRELSCYKLTNYLIADHALPRAIQEGRTDQFIDRLLRDLLRRLCMDKRKRPSLRRNVRTGNSCHSESKIIWSHNNVA